MGAKASTANGEESSRPSTTDDNSAADLLGSAGFNILRSIPNLSSNSRNTTHSSLTAPSSSDRQRARSLSGFPSPTNNNNSDEDRNQRNLTNARGGVRGASRAGISSIDPFDLGNLLADNDRSSNTSVSADENSLDESLSAIGFNRFVYPTRSLPSHIWSFNGIKCPVCSKFVLPDDVECHLVICLTKPRLNYNEDVLTCDKGECVICLEDLLQGDTIARLPCLCVYHKSCIDQWFDVNRSCPEHPGD